MENVKETISKNLKRIRLEKGLTQKELADIAGIAENTIISIESNKNNTICSIDTLNKIANSLKINLICFFDESSDTYLEHTNNKKSKIIEKRKHDEDILSIYYPPKEPHKRVTSLLEFVLYLPLMNLQDIYTQLLSRVEGDIIYQEDYIENLIDRLINNIPDSEAKKYADIALKESKMIRGGITPNKYPDMFMKYSADKYNEYLPYYNAYLKKLESNSKNIIAFNSVLNSNICI